MSGPLRQNERDAPPVRRSPAGVGCPVRQDHVTLALASLAIGVAAVVADKAPLRRPAPAVRPVGGTGAIAASCRRPGSGCACSHYMVGHVMACLIQAFAVAWRFDHSLRANGNMDGRRDAG